MRPYPAARHHEYSSVTIDPDTQLGVFRDGSGGVVELGKHGGTHVGTETQPQSTHLDGVNDTDHDQDSTRD